MEGENKKDWDIIPNPNFKILNLAPATALIDSLAQIKQCLSPCVQSLLNHQKALMQMNWNLLEG